MANDGLRTQYPYGGLSPRPLYDFPSPTSNYASGVPATSPSFFPMAYNISPRFGGSAFIPPADVFGDARNGSTQDNAPYTPRALKDRGSEALSRDPVAMHLLVETAMIDSQNFDILSVEEVEALKQEQKGLDGKLGTTRRRLESETKIRDAARSLTRLKPRDGKGHQRGLSSRSGPLVKDTSARSQEEFEASNKKVEELTRELLEIESRMRLIDMQLLMHTSAVLQLTHNGPRKRKQNAELSNGGDRRPDSPASIYTYENERGIGAREDGFDERSLYRSPENLDSLMNALQNGTHHHSHSIDQQNQSLVSMSKRLEELNGRLRGLIVQANPERNEKYSLPPQAPGSTTDASSLDRQLDFLDQGLRDISTEQATQGKSMGSLTAVEERLEGINNQLYAMLNASDDNVPPPPSLTGSGFQTQLDYMEDSFYSIERLQYALNDQLDDLRTEAAGKDGVEKYETTLMGLWQIIHTGEEEARARKRERRRLLAEDPDNEEELSPDESDVGEEPFSLPAFSSKVQTLFRRAMSLKDKQSILVRQIKQQRELNSKSDAQREEQVNDLKEQILSARSEKMSMEAELDRAMDQLQLFDTQKEQKTQDESQALHDVQERNIGLESQIREIQERSTAFEAQIREAEERSLGYEAQIRNAQERAFTLEAQLKEAQDEARVEAATIQAELAQSTAKIDEASTALRAATVEKEAAESRATEAASTLSAKENELRNLEGEVVRLTTELTFAKAELDGAYGTRAERAAESGATTKKELDELASKNVSLFAEITALQKVSEAASQSEQEARDSERNLKAELAGMATEYEELTRDAIQNEKDRDALEASIDKLRDEKEALELELSDERVKWLGIRSPSVAAGATGAGAPDMGATSIRMLREDFRKMMRDRTAEALRALRSEQEERRKLEAQVRQLRKDALPPKSNLSRSMTPATSG
ncbi:hypothetical protein N0V90_007237 [Kalmusia sp. IMI 367209]|nr:hypothetical protein N0V90_007237 [Kalmusia sp. IMI 367209]